MDEAFYVVSGTFTVFVAGTLHELGPGSAGENAAPWIHLYAATILLLVILPRLVLAGAASYRVRRFAQHFPIPLDHGYFLRLLQAWRER